MFYEIYEFLRVAILEKIIQDPFWASVAFIGQVAFGGRFILQWLVSEYKKQSHIPLSFWYISIFGSVLLFIYFVHRREPIFMLAFSVNTLIYIRNLHLIHKKKKQGEVIVATEKQTD